MLAAFVLATHKRPQKLDLALEHMRQFSVPGWELEVVVCGHPNDPGRAVVERTPGAYYVPESENIIGLRWNRALYATDADLVMLTGDDDLQSGYRLQAAVKARDEGNLYSATSCCWFVNSSTRQVSLWRLSAGIIGATVNVDGHLMRDIGGWHELSRNNDHALRRKLSEYQVTPYNLDDSVGLDTVCLHDDTNVTPRPWPAPGRTVKHGKASITGATWGSLPQWAQNL